MRVFLTRFLELFRRREDLLSEEIQTHLDLLTEQHVNRGLNPIDARAAARRAFGGVEAMKEQYRDQRALPFIDNLGQDLRYAAKTLRRSPAFTAAAIGSLALGLGANIAIFSVFDAVLLKSLPVRDPEQLVALISDGGRRGDYSYPVFQAVRTEQPFVDVFASAGGSRVNVEIGDGVPERADVSLVSGSYFSVLGLSAAAGRVFTERDDAGDAAAVAVLSHRYWQRRFGGDLSVVGSAVRLGGASVSIVGVAPRGFFGERVGAEPDIWVPLALFPQVVGGRNLLQSPGTAWLRLMGRARPDINTAQASAALTTIYRRTLTETFGPSVDADTRREIAEATMAVTPASRGLSALRAKFSRPLRILMAVVALVLLLGCANVANLLLARAAVRRREIGLRVALGVSRGRLVRQLLTESLLLSMVSGVVGLLIASWGTGALLRLVSADGSSVPLAADLDTRLLAFAAALSVVTGAVFGLAPAWQSSRTDVSSVIGLGRTDSGTTRGVVSRVLVVGQVAVSLVLIVGAGLFLRTLSRLNDVDLGFAPDRLVILDVDPRAAGYKPDQYEPLFRRLLASLDTIPEVTSATLSQNGVLTGRDSSTNRMRPAGFAPDVQAIPQARFDMVGPQYLATMGIPLLAGRDIAGTDTAAVPRVVIINEEMARRFFPDGSPIGQRMLWPHPVARSDQEFEVIGVARDVRQRGPRDDVPLRFYVPYFQSTDRGLLEMTSARIALRTASDPQRFVDAVRQTVQSEERRMPIVSIVTASVLVERTLVQERMIATLSAAFGLLALALASVGLYGLMAYRVARRTAEIGLRLALGAPRAGVLWMILRQDLTLVGAGVLAGIPLALAAARTAQTLLFGIEPHDPVAMAVGIGVMVIVALLAGSVPAIRAARIEPSVALRHD